MSHTESRENEKIADKTLNNLRLNIHDKCPKCHGEECAYCEGYGYIYNELGLETRHKIIEALESKDKALAELRVEKDAEIERWQQAYLDEKELCVRVQAERDALKAENERLKQGEVRRIAYLNRLATWAQQDPTGPWEKLDIQEWVLNQIKGALGQPVKGESRWHPRIVDEIYALKSSNWKLREALKKTHDEMLALAKKFKMDHAPCHICESLKTLGGNSALSPESKEGEV